MTRFLRVLPFAVAVFSCDPPIVNPPPPANPPQAFITVNEANVIGGEVKGKVNVSGCKTIAGLELLEGNNFLQNIGNPDGGTKSPTDFSLSPGTFATFYGQRGISTSLTLKAKVTCDDGRTNASQPVGVKFFPVTSRLAGPGGAQVVPDTFLAEGGVGGTPVTFLGCALTEQGGTTIARVDALGTVLGITTAHPFDCTADTIISERSNTMGTRWVMQPGAGAYAINQNLDVVRQISGNAKRIGVGKNGSAIVWLDEQATMQRVVKVDPFPNSTNEWAYQTSAIMNSTPVIDEGTNSVWFSMWAFIPGTMRKSQTSAFKLNYNTGQLLNPFPGGSDPGVLYEQIHSQSDIDIPLMPEGVFNSDGSLFTMPLMSYTNGVVISTTIVHCPTSGIVCTPQTRRWASQTFPTMLRAVVPFSQGNYLAAIGPFAVYFLNAQTGTVANLSEVPIQPSGSNIVVAVQPGQGSDFYVLTGPNYNELRSYPNEIIATDSPGAGELWRMEYGSGESNLNGVTMGIDDNRQAWLRVGTDLVKPLSNAEYRMARGPTVIP